ncbi:MAG: NADH-quinone oxidoreductase subunit A [Bacteroidetes bacterium QH_9_64_21]|nr:MAG: NADH-quinone oxidoreductase subunit A [Bacteroidetes bacterium QH_9_64_21]
MFGDFVPLFLMIALALGLALTLLAAAAYIGPSRPSGTKTMPYESGMDPVGSAHERYSVKFYLVVVVSLFTIILLVGLLYDVKKGGLDFEQ